MKSIKSFFARIGSWFSQMASPGGQKQLNQVLVTAYDLLNLAIPVVETIALATPTQADDEIISHGKTLPSACLASSRSHTG